MRTLSAFFSHISLSNFRAVLQVKLVVVDSVTSLYRAEYADYSMLSRRQHQLLKIMHILQNIAQTYNTAVVVTNQIQTTPEELGYNSDKPVGGNVMAHSSAFRISLRGSDPDYMSAKLVTSPCYPQDYIHFAINERGIADVTDHYNISVKARTSISNS